MTYARYKCTNCKDEFTARTADRARGWARFCSKSCKAKKQEARTGQYSALLQGRGSDDGLCHPSFAEGEVQ